MTAKYLGAAKYILRSNETFIQPGESWFEILDAGGARLCRVPMTADQAGMCVKENRLSTISPAQFLNLLRENA